MELWFRANQEFREKLMIWTCLAIIGLQGADAYSTYLGISTGHILEKNHLLLSLAHHADAPLAVIIAASKVLIIVLFILAMKKSKPTWINLLILISIATYYSHIVFMNMFWYLVFENQEFRHWIVKTLA